MSARYLTTTLPYVNAAPHLGHALEFVEADCYKRAALLSGDEVFLNIGTDEHGAKVAEKAAEAGKTPQEYTDEYAARFKVFADRLNISYDAFTRTTDPAHLVAAQEFWKRCEAAGDIYKAEYEIKYCVGCELEKTDSELEEGKCPIHLNLQIETRTEENYYFRFSKYQQALLELYASQEGFVTPTGRQKEIQSFVAGGLKDFSISRRKEKLSWGIPVPGDDEHVMYVWFDALVNYISVIGWPTDAAKFDKWWPVTQFAGKDNLRQQSAMWQAMLMSAGLAPSKQVFIHGFITTGGQKMSKSLGNVINPIELIEKYGVDAVRYIVLRHVSPFEDSDLTLEAIHDHYTAHLTNGLGNLVARVMKLAEEHLASPVALTAEDTRVEQSFIDTVSQFRFNEAMDLIFTHVTKGDVFMTEHEPYKKIKSDDPALKEEAKNDIEKLVRHLAKIARHLVAVMPTTAEIIRDAVEANKKPDNIFPRVV
jgi:methionyl-tRNA synthetase